MAKNTVFRVYKDEETMLKVYQRRLSIADVEFEDGKQYKEAYMERYRLTPNLDQLTDRGHLVTVAGGTGLVDTMYSSMTAVDVEFITTAIGNGTNVQALAATAALNQAFRDTKGQKRLKKAVKDAVIMDIGWAKVYYDYVTDVELRDVPEEALKAQAEELLADNEDMDRDELAGILADNSTEEVEIVLRDRVCIDHVPWDAIRFDTSAKTIEDVRWVAQYTKLPLEEVRQSPMWVEHMEDRYGKKKTKELLDDLKGDTSVLSGLEGNYRDLEGLAKDESEDDPRVTVVEMWDLETGLVTTFPKGHFDLVLFQRTNPLMFNTDLEDRNPFKPLVVRDDPDRLEGLGDMRVIYPSLKELDEYRNISARYAAMPPKLIGPDNALTPAGKKALQSQEMGEYIGLESGIGKDQVGDLKPPILAQEVYQLQEQIQFEMKEATGASEPMRGVFPSRRTTATETEIVTSAGEQRQAERRGELEYWYISIARTMLQLMQLFYDSDRMLRYTDDLGDEFEWEWNKADIAIDADIEIALTPKENLTRAERVQRALMFANLALPLPETDRGELLKWMAREMGLRDDIVRSLVKGDEETAVAGQAEAAAQQLSVRPQPFGDSPAGLNIGAGGPAQ